MARVLALALLALAAGGCRGDDGEPGPFAYDARAPLGLRVAAEQAGGGVRILDVTFAAPGGAVAAFLVRPAGPGPFPVLLYQHGGGSTRADFLEEAAAMAERGAASVLVQAPERPSARGEIVATVLAWRRALDLAEERPELDERRLAYVGISFGAAVGAVLAGTDGRVGAAVLLSGPPRWRGAGAEDLDPEDWIGKADARLLFQVGRADDVVPLAEAESLYEAAPGPKEIRRYDAGHLLNAQAQRERIAWLSDRLGLG